MMDLNKISKINTSFNRCEKIVTEYVVMLSSKWFLYNAVAKSVLCDAAICINLQVINIAVLWISTLLVSMEGVVSCSIVLERQPLLHPQKDSDEAVILLDRLLRELWGMIVLYFEQFVVIWFTSWYRSFIDVKMKILCQFIKSVSGHISLFYEWMSKCFIFDRYKDVLRREKETMMMMMMWHPNSTWRPKNDFMSSLLVSCHFESGFHAMNCLA